MSEKIETFSGFNLSPETLQALKKKGFVSPTGIQSKIIPVLLDGGRDIIGKARTGTGKTAAFGIPLVEKIIPGQQHPGALILVPTRELCMQVATEISSLSADRKLRVSAVYGGQPIEIQMRQLKRGADVAVGTPGRVLDLIRREVLVLQSVQYVVLDEADEMLDMGFVEDIREILSHVPIQRKMLMFSATMPEAARKIADDFMPGFTMITAENDDVSLSQVEHVAYCIPRDRKPAALQRILALNPDFYGLVFCRTRMDVDELSEKLNNAGLQVEALHGEISQAQRTRVIERFKRRGFSLLVATDVAARGIDINDLSFVVNYSLPLSAESFIHRSGRTGRAGKSGCAITFFTPGERRRYERICQESNIRPFLRDIPDANALADAGRNALQTKLLAYIENGEVPESYLHLAKNLMQYDAAKIIAALVYECCGRKLDPGSFQDIRKQRRANDRNGVADIPVKPDKKRQKRQKSSSAPPSLRNMLGTWEKELENYPRGCKDKSRSQKKRDKN